jgi:leader peptidase (prepilin peptidase)/N-methyltransferase
MEERKMNAVLTAVSATCVLAALWSVACGRARVYGLRLELLQHSAVAVAVLAVALCLWLPGSLADRAAREVLVACCAISAVTDMQTGYVFDRVLAVAAILLLPAVAASGRLENAVIGAAVAAGLLLLPYAVSRGKGLGLGDVKLAAFIGFGLGNPAAIGAVWSAFVLGGIAAAFLLARVRGARTMPFAPYLCAGAGCALVWSR